QWLRLWGHSRMSAIGISLAVMTLPAYQIVVADGTQLVVPMVLAIGATFLFYYGFQRHVPLAFVAAGVLLYAALAIYQQQALIAFAFLIVPLMRRPGDARAQTLVITGAVFV